jgi:hypothetical protein
MPEPLLVCKGLSVRDFDKMPQKCWKNMTVLLRNFAIARSFGNCAMQYSADQDFSDRM